MSYSPSDFKPNMKKYLAEIVSPAGYYDWLHQYTTLNGVPFNCNKFPFQRAILEDMSLNMSVIKPSQVGLALDLDTPIATTDGWTVMGQLQVGDKVFDPKGRPTLVTYVSPVYLNHECYELEFCDGERIVADAKHRWAVEGYRAFNAEGQFAGSGRIKKGSGFARNGVIDTETMFKCYKTPDRSMFAIPTTEELEGKDENILVDPYFLGLWLGDGRNASCNLTSHVEDVDHYVQELESRGMTCRVTLDKGDVNTIKVDVPNAVRHNSMYSRLMSLGVIGKDKYIPKQYLRASIKARFELLCGLLDTDGSITKRGRVSFYNTSPQLVEDVVELIRSLGFKPRTRWKQPKRAVMKSGRVINSKKEVAEIGFLAYQDTPVFKLPRKLDRQLPTGRRSESFRRRIVNMTKVESRPVRCITVASEEHLFLAGKGMIATHNTELQLRKALALVARNPHRTLIYTLPDKDMRKRVYQTRIEPFLESTPIFNPAGFKPTRSIEITQIEHSFMMMFSADEKSATSQPADAVFMDEVDLSDQQVLALFNSRMQGSDWKMNQRFSTPTYTGFGISQTYELSDQHNFMFKCPHCNAHQIPEFTPEFVRIPNLPSDLIEDYTKIEEQWIDKYRINIHDTYMVCNKCHKPVTYGKAENHEWIAKHSHRNSRGYKVTPFCTSNLTAAYILGQLFEYKRVDNIKGFHNTVLGLAYEGGDERLQEALLKLLFMGRSSEQQMNDGSSKYFIGIDMGNLCYITIGRANRYDNIETVHFEIVPKEQLYARVKFYDEHYHFTQGFIDRVPLISDSEAIRDLTGGRIMPMQYGGSSNGILIEDKYDEYQRVSYIMAQRTPHIDKVVNALKAGYIAFSGYGGYQEIIISHLRDMVRVLVKSDNEKMPIWKKLTGNDHFFHSLGYMNQAVYQHFKGVPAETKTGTIIYLAGLNSVNMMPTQHKLI